MSFVKSMDDMSLRMVSSTFFSVSNEAVEVLDALAVAEAAWLPSEVVELLLLFPEPQPVSIVVLARAAVRAKARPLLNSLFPISSPFKDVRSSMGPEL